MTCDQELIHQTLSGNDDAFKKIIEKYKGYVFAIILNYIKDYNEAENIAQEVFLQVYTSLPKFNYDNFKGWIGKIAVNKSIDWKRKKNSKCKDKTVENIETLVDIKKTSCLTPEEILINKENKQKIHTLINSIPQIYKTVIIKFYFEEKNYEQIARECNISTKTVASRLYRGRKILKEKWREKDEAL